HRASHRASPAPHGQVGEHFPPPLGPAFLAPGQFRAQQPARTRVAHLGVTKFARVSVSHAYGGYGGSAIRVGERAQPSWLLPRASVSSRVRGGKTWPAHRES